MQMLCGSGAASSPGEAGDKRDDNSAYATDWRTSRLSPGVSSGLAQRQAGVRWCGIFQVVKTAQSRERTERTLLTGLISALRGRPRGAQECCGQA
jgi:hypothetical protein